MAGHVTQMERPNFCYPYPMRRHMKFGFDLPSSFWSEDVWRVFTIRVYVKQVPPWGGAIFDPRASIWTILVEIYNLKLHTGLQDKRAKMALYRSPDYQSLSQLPFGSREVQYWFSRWWPSWISDQNDFSFCWSKSHLDTPMKFESIALLVQEKGRPKVIIFHTYWAYVPNAAYQAPEPFALRRRFLHYFYHIWAWRPSWSCDPESKTW